MGGASFAPKEGRGGTGGLVPKLRLKEDKASVRKGTDVSIIL